MPLYNYNCENPMCKEHLKEIELNVPINDRDLQVCPECKRQLKRGLTYASLLGFDNLGRSN